MLLAFGYSAGRNPLGSVEPNTDATQAAPFYIRHSTATHQIDLVDAHTGTVLCPVRPLDKSANADGQRRALTWDGV